MSGRPSDIALTKTSALVGSPLFMAPEQMRSARDVDAGADIWALGAILYFLLSAREPFDGETLPQLCVAVMHEPHRRLGELRPDVPEAIEQIVSKCLAKERSQRFASLAQLAEALLPFAPGFRAHAERAARLLSRTVRDSLTPMPVMSVTATVAQSHSEVPAVVDTRPPEPGATQASWNKTDRGAANRRRAPLIAFGVVAALLGVGFAFFRYSGDAAPAATPSSAAGVTETSATSPLQNVAAATPAAEVRPTPAAAAPVAPVAAPSLSPPVSSAASTAPTAAAVAARPAAAIRATAAKRAPAAEPRALTKPGSDVTYFGGRR
ncbi:MAG: protein kinase [Polyangiaceae bacterium]